MAITSTSLGTRTAQITTSGLTNTHVDFYLAIKNAIIGTSPVLTTGWTLYDEFDTGHMHTQVFRAYNADASTYKYLILRYNSFMQEINTSSCESWNVATHVPSNEVYTFYECSPVSYSLQACDVIIFVCPRWCILYSYINNEPGLWAGVVEMAREDANDTPANGYPCWGWISSCSFMLGSNGISGNPLGNSSQHTMIHMPRTRDGSTGINASKKFGGVYEVFAYPIWLHSTATVPYYLNTANAKFQNNGWNSTGRFAFPIKPVHNYTDTVVTNYGTIYGLKLTAPAGQTMNKLTLAIDTDGNYSSSGTNNDHWLLNNAFKFPGGGGNFYFGNTGWNSTTISIVGMPYNMISTGTAYYLNCTDGVLRKYSTLTQTTVTIAGVTTSANTYEMRYDGERYIYFSTSVGLGRLDIRDDSVINLTLTNGAVYGLAISASYICYCNSTAQNTLTPVFYRFSRTGTFDATTAQATTFTTTSMTTNRYVNQIEATIDNDFFAVTWHNGTVNTAAIIKITAAGVVSWVTPTNPITNTYSANLYYITHDTWLYTNTNSSGASNQALYYPRTATLSSNYTTAIGTQSPTGGKSFGIKIAGTIVMMPKTVNACYATTLGANTTTGFGGAWSDVGAPSTYSFNQAGFISSDGTKIFATGSATNTLKIFTNINGNNPTAGETLAQLLLPS